jgi:hypothetical protein
MRSTTAAVGRGSRSSSITNPLLARARVYASSGRSVDADERHCVFVPVDALAEHPFGEVIVLMLGGSVQWVDDHDA